MLTESAVRWRLCEPSIMSVQLDHLVSVSLLPAVNIGVLPLATGVPDGAFHTFVVYDAKLVTAELFSGQLVLRDPKDVDYYTDLFEFFNSRSLSGDDARDQLSAWADEFRRES